jgi:hypothetical protein
MFLQSLCSFYPRGYICDHCLSPVYVQPMGSLFTILGLGILGPAPYLPENPWVEVPNHVVSTVGLSLMGIGTAALLVSETERQTERDRSRDRDREIERDREAER